MNIQRIWEVTTIRERWLALISVFSMFWWTYCIFTNQFGLLLYIFGVIWGASGITLYLSLKQPKKE